MQSASQPFSTRPPSSRSTANLPDRANTARTTYSNKFGSVSPLAPPGEGDRITPGNLRFQPIAATHCGTLVHTTRYSKR